MKDKTYALVCVSESTRSSNMGRTEYNIYKPLFTLE